MWITCIKALTSAQSFPPFGEVFLSFVIQLNTLLVAKFQFIFIIKILKNLNFISNISIDA